MAMTASTANAPIGADLVYRAVTGLEHAVLDLKTTILNLRNLSRVRATAKSLNALSDRELFDLGLVRADIRRISRGVGRRTI